MTSTAHRGKSLEDALTRLHRVYWQEHKVLVRHNRVAGAWKGTHFVPMPDKSAPDFYGCDRGKFYAFEAKQSHEHRWRLDKRFKHQFTRLQDWALAGAFAWFAVEWAPGETLHLLRVYPTSDYPVVEFREPSRDDLLKVQLNNAGLYDWLPAVRKNWL
jgi:penicillin-binding protein-related factor A (putative recombinase)